jgi:uncharacterized membrane protein YeaQ/YmgE (transglycosylase-associated protein family)
MGILTLILVGLVAGAIARLLIPGTGGMGILATLAIGVVGSFVGGFLGWLIFDHDKSFGAFQASGLLGSIIGAVIVLLIYKAVSGNRSAVSR